MAALDNNTLLVIIAFLNGGALTLFTYFVGKNDRDHKEINRMLWELKNGKKEKK